MPGTSFQAIIPAIDQHDDQRGGNCGRHRRQRRVRDRPGARRDGNVSFSYTLCDSGNPAPAPCSTTATVTFNIAGPIIWFVNPAAATNGDGRLSSPFTTLAAADAVDAANHRIFVYAGTATTGLTLNAGEWLIGQGVTGFAGFDALMGITPPSGTIARPTIGSGAATLQGTVALASNTVVKGVAITTSGATPGMTGSGGLTGVSVEQVAIATATGSALTLNNVGGTLSFSSISATGAATGIGLTNVSAPVTISGGTIQNTTTAGIALDGGAASFSFAGGIANSTGRSVLVHNRTGGARS